MNRLFFAVFLASASVGASAEEAPIASNFSVNSYLNSCSSCPTSYSPEKPGDEGKLRFICEASHLAYDDPIVNPGQPGAAHLHMFFGNTATNASSTYQSLRTTGGGSCEGGPLNRSGYWFPALISPAKSAVVKPDVIVIYYTVNRWKTANFTSPACPSSSFACPQYAAQRFPRGLKMISGYDFATEKSSGFGGWACSGGSDTTSRPTLAEVNCPSTYQLIASLDFPDCWDGKNLDSANHRSHLAWRFQDGYGNPVCPSTHPYVIPAISMKIFWSHNGSADYSQWYVSSDRYGGRYYAGGKTFHSDWFGAWDDGIMATWAAEVNGIPAAGIHTRSSNNGGLGNGMQLLNSGQNPNPEPEESRYLPIPGQETPIVKNKAKGKGHNH